MINNVTLVGRLVKTPELRYSQQGTAVASFTIAVNRFGKDEADFINCVTFKKTAENLANYTDKGSMIGLVGSIQVRTYEKDGQKRWVTEVIANSIQFLTPKGSNNSDNGKGDAKISDDPFGGGKAIDINDDSLPF